MGTKPKPYDPDQCFESPSQAIKIIMTQASPLDALLDTIRANILKDEYGFASELVVAFSEVDHA